MARGNAALQKKLAELESEIGRLLEHPSSSIHDDIDGKVGFYQNARKITFIKNLLTAEIDSHSGGRPEHLNHMAMRLSTLEKNFVNWAIPARFSVLDETLVNCVESGDGNGAVNKSSDTSASCSCTGSCVVDEEFVDEDNVNQETILSQVTVRGSVENTEEEVIEDEEENQRNQEEEKGPEREVAARVEKIRDRKQGEMVEESAVEITEDEEEGRERKQGGKVGESKVEVNEVEKVGEKKQEAEMVEERKAAVKEDAEERYKDHEGKTVEEVKVEATEEKRRWKQEGEMIGERTFEAEEYKGSERKEGAEVVGERREKEIEEAMGREKSAEVKDEEEIERNYGRQMVGESIVQEINDKQEERKEEGEMMRATMRGRGRKGEAETVGMHTAEVKEDEKGRERKLQSHRIKNYMAMGCAAAAGFAIALIGVAVANMCWMEETVYLVPT